MRIRIRSITSVVGLCAAICTGGSFADPTQKSSIRFTDVTADSGVDFTMTSGKTPSRYILEVDGGGVALFDYDGDGDLDLFFANGATLDEPEKGPGSRLYANKGNGKFLDVTEKVGINLRRWAMGVAVGDYDSDGADDLYVTCFGANVLLRNDVAKSGRFTDVTETSGVGNDRWGTSAAFGDLDADGDLDLYLVNYLEFDPENPPDRAGSMILGVNVMAGPSGLLPQQDVLYENRGDGTFRDVTSQSGCLPGKPGFGLGVVVFDMDLDGKLDILVGNDSTENFLFRNLGGLRFKEIGVVSGIASNYDGANQATMGIAIADVDGNGYPDVFTTNFSSDTNTLHLNLGNAFFDDRTSQFGLAMISHPFLSWGTGFYDFDSDADEDLFIANGHVYPETAEHPMDTNYEQRPMLFERAGKRFRYHLESGEIFERRFPARSTAFGDIDDDGDVDVIMTTLNDKVRVFRNDSPHRQVLVVELRSARGGSQVQGALVELVVGDRAWRRWITGGSYQSSDAPVAYFGPGAVAEGVKPSVRVTWPNGKKGVYSGILFGRKVTITEGEPTPRITPLRGRAD